MKNKKENKAKAFVNINDKIVDNNDNKITNNAEITTINKSRNNDNKHNLLSVIISCFFDSAEKCNLDNKKVNEVIKEIQHLFNKNSKERDKRCFVCGRS